MLSDAAKDLLWVAKSEDFFGSYLSNEKKTPWLVGVLYRGLRQLYIGIIINEYKDPY